MRTVVFCHSLVSDWNHGNAHFLRGVCRELVSRGHEVRVFEPRDGWSRENLLREHGPAALEGFAHAFPELSSTTWTMDTLDLDELLEGAGLVLVHEWNDPALVRRIGAHRLAGGRYRLLFHDTHHRSVTEAEKMAQYDLSGFDGVLAFGEVIRRVYEDRGWARRAFTWHEAADVRLFHPVPNQTQEGDLVWIGNWGDGERTAELREFLLEPVQALALRARVHGVRYPEAALGSLRKAGITYGGWLANHQVPATFARYRVTVHVPRGPYVAALPGIPTIRPFEALACGIPLVSAPWKDVEGLFAPGEDFLVARTGAEMKRHLHDVLHDPQLAASLSARGRARILERHTCSHRVDELLGIVERLKQGGP